MFNSHNELLEFTLPEEKWGETWTVVLNTAEEKDFMSEQEDGSPWTPGPPSRYSGGASGCCADWRPSDCERRPRYRRDRATARRPSGPARPIMTSVAFTTASASSPRFSFNSSTASRVMMAVRL